MINAGQVDFGQKSDFRGCIRVQLVTNNSKQVDAVFIGQMRRSENGAVPVGHGNVILVDQTVSDRFGAEALFPLLQLFKELEISWALLLVSSEIS